MESLALLGKPALTLHGPTPRNAQTLPVILFGSNFVLLLYERHHLKALPPQVRTFRYMTVLLKSGS